ncbi:MAG: anti-sigma factor [Actinomycetota bacterium]
MRTLGIARREMVCQEFVEVVTSYLEGSLPRRDAGRLEAHLRQCDGCTEYLDQMRRTARLAGRLTTADIPAPGRDRLLEMFERWKAEGPAG